MRNLYKRMDVFRCSQDGHEHFENAVSVYHVLRERRCYPEGCIYFQWRCRHPLGGKGCPQGFQHVGRKCLSCRHFYDEKILRTPRLLLSPEAYQGFLKDLRGFEEWLRGLQRKEVSVWGALNSVKPWFKEMVHPHGSRVAFIGFLLNFSEAYFDLVHWNDFCYVTISKRLQAVFRFRSGDRVSFRARMRWDKGRPVLHRVREVEVEARGEGECWTESKALLAQRLGTSFPDQPDRCLACEKGALLDIVEETGSLEKRDRRLYCLKGISDPRVCAIYGEAELAMERCRMEEARSSL